MSVDLFEVEYRTCLLVVVSTGKSYEDSGDERIAKIGGDYGRDNEEVDRSV